MQVDIILGWGWSGSLNQLFKDHVKVAQISGHLPSCLSRNKSHIEIVIFLFLLDIEGWRAERGRTGFTEQNSVIWWQGHHSSVAQWWQQHTNDSESVALPRVAFSEKPLWNNPRLAHDFTIHTARCMSVACSPAMIEGFLLGNLFL